MTVNDVDADLRPLDEAEAGFRERSSAPATRRTRFTGRYGMAPSIATPR
jgi:hypothetical protein